MYEGLLAIRDRALAETTILDRLGYEDSGYLLATVHRASNTDDSQRLRAIAGVLAAAACSVVFPAHPRTVEALAREGLLDDLRTAIDHIDPVGYLDFVRLIDGAERVATDFGGVQKGAFLP